MSQDEPMSQHDEAVLIALLVGMAEEAKAKLVALEDPNSLEWQQIYQRSMAQWKVEAPDEAAEWEKRFGNDFP